MSSFYFQTGVLSGWSYQNGAIHYEGNVIRASYLESYELDIATWKWQKSYFRIKTKMGREFSLPIKSDQISEAMALRRCIGLDKIMQESEEKKTSSRDSKSTAEARNKFVEAITSDSKETKKEASVVGRAVVGGVIAGPAGAVVGALSAVDKNRKG